jgi:hypothetical protein
MKLIKIILFLILAAGIFLAGYFTSRGFNFTGNAVLNQEEYSWTKAVCNSDNECIDLVIHCKNSRVIRIEPIFYKVSHPANWSDFRLDRYVYCE